jgi:hypothetical protein
MQLGSRIISWGDNYRGALIVTDLAPNGNVVRETRVEMLLPAKTRDALPDLQRSFAVRFPRSGCAHAVQPGMPLWVIFRRRDFTITQSVPQWSPIVTRQTRIGGVRTRSESNGKRSDAKCWIENAWEVARTVAGDSGCKRVIFLPTGIWARWTQLIVDQKLLEALTLHAANVAAQVYSRHLSPSGAAELNTCVHREWRRPSMLVIAARRDGQSCNVCAGFTFISASACQTITRWFPSRT